MARTQLKIIEIKRRFPTYAKIFYNKSLKKDGTQWKIPGFASLTSLVDKRNMKETAKARGQNLHIPQLRSIILTHHYVRIELARQSKLGIAK